MIVLGQLWKPAHIRQHALALRYKWNHFNSSVDQFGHQAAECLQDYCINLLSSSSELNACGTENLLWQSILFQSLSGELQGLAKHGGKYSSNVPCLVPGDEIRLGFGKSVIVLTEINSKYCEEVDVTGIKAEEVWITCQLLFFISNTKGKAAQISKSKQTQILNSKTSSKMTCFLSKTTAWCFVQRWLHDVPSPLFIGGISFHILAALVHDVLRGKEQTRTHTWFIFRILWFTVKHFIKTENSFLHRSFQSATYSNVVVRSMKAGFTLQNVLFGIVLV